MHRVPAAALLAVLVVLVHATAAHGAAEVYRARHRPAQELLPIAQTLLAGEGSVALDEGSNSLVLLGEDAAVARVVELLARQDQPLPSVVLHYVSQRSSDLETAGVRVRWNLANDSFRVGNVEGVALGAGAASLRASGEMRGTLRVLPGKTGRIQTGVLVPYTERSLHGESLTWVDASSGFEVTPRVLGDGRVQLELRPFEARPSGETIRHSGLATTVVVEPGRSVVVGGIARTGAAASRSLAGGGGGGASAAGGEERVLLIEVELEGGGGGPAGERAPAP